MFITKIEFSQQGIIDLDHRTMRSAIFQAEAKKLGCEGQENHNGLVLVSGECKQ